MAEDFSSFESFSGVPGGKEKAQETDEQFSDRYRQAQAAIQQTRKQEARKKQDDNSLATTIVQFLNDPRFTQLFLLISKLVAINIPSDMIIAIIALVHEPSRKLIEEKFTANFEKLASPQAPEATKRSQVRIDDWINKIFVVASAEPHRVLETCLDHDRKLQPILVQFSTLVLRQYLENREKRETNFDNLQSFCVTFWNNLMKQMESQVDYQLLLKNSENEGGASKEDSFE